MRVEKTYIDGLLILAPNIFEDDRGYFFESYSKRTFSNLGIDIEFVQDNHSMSLKKGTIRGLHFQNSPMAQTKLVRCTAGSVLDVAVDLRPQSLTYKKWFSVELSSKNKTQFFIPHGFAHGFLTLEDNTEIQYKVDNFYSKEHDRSVIYNDPDINIDWQFEDKIILSDKDAKALFLKDIDICF